MTDRMLIERLIDATTGPLEAALRMLGVATAEMIEALDVFELLDRRRPVDPLDQRDPHYIEQTLPALRLFADAYFRAEVRGLEHVPEDEPVLLVGNHSGGTLIADTFVFAQSFYDHFGTNRRFHQLAHDLVFKAPAARAMLSRYGTIPASPENMKRALRRGAALLVYPGG